MRLTKDVPYGPGDDQRLDLYLPDGAEARDLFLYFHGGGLNSGSKEWGKGMARYLCERGIAVASADYRMMPSHAYPDFLCDAALASAFCRDWLKSRGGGRLFLGGSSAGCYLTMMLCFDGRWLGEVGVKGSEIAGYLHDAGQPTAHYNVLAHRGEDSRRVIVDDTAPLYHVKGGMTLPPMHFVVSDDDLPGRYAQTMLLIETLRIFGHTAPQVTLEVRHGTHCHYTGAVDENGDSELGKLAYAFLQRI